MKKISIALLGATALLSVGFDTAFADAEINDTRSIGAAERSFTVKYQNGSVINHVGLYTGTVHIYRYQDGGPSTWNHPFDDRKCHWTITPKITRQSFAVMPDGERAEKKDTLTVYSVPFQNQGSDFVLTQLRSENCGDAQARFESDINNAVAAVNRDLNTLANSDLPKLLDIYRNKQKVVSVGS